MFHGTFTALVTPFRSGRIDTVALTQLVDRQIAGGISGLVPCGTTGEAPTLSEAEQVEVVRCVVERAADRVPVIAGTGSNCTEKTIAASRRALDAGVTAVMVVAPYYNKPNPTGLYRHFAAVAEAVGAPIILYNIPGRCGVEIPVEVIARLRSAYSNVVAVKHATGSVDAASRLAGESDIMILSGDDPLTLPLMSVGARGVISVLSNLLPAEVSALTRTALEGDYAAARSWHFKLYALMRGILSLDTNPIPIKTALSLRGWMTDEFRLPMCELSPEACGTLRKLLDTFEHAGSSMPSRRIAS